MKLSQLKLKNFRGYKNETIISFNDLTAFIGKNDAGKSTILEALEIFFNNDLVSIDKDDLCKDALQAGETEVEITCTFDDLPATLVLDAAAPTTLAAEYLLNLDERLEVKKIFACTAANPKEKVFIVANYPTANNYGDLHQLKQAQLRARASDLGVPPANYNANINSSIRQAIWNNSPNLGLAISAIQIDKEDTKRIWEILSTWMPVYALFQSDRKSKDDDKEVTDPMKVAVQEALREVEQQLAAIQETVKNKAIEVAERTLEKLNEMNPGLANQLTPDFKKNPAWSTLFSLTLSSDNGIPINKRGSGVRRLIVLNFFRAEAERRRNQVNNPSIIYAFEEPETSQHPDNQKMLVDAFKELVASPNTQVILTTHTPALGGLIPHKDTRFVTINAAGVIAIEEGTDAAYEKIAKTLGVLPDPLGTQIQLLICVEGPNDIAFLKNIAAIVRIIDATIPDIFNDSRIAIIPLGGGTLKDWVNHNYLSGLKKPEFHIYDRDDVANPPYQASADLVISRGGNNYAVLTAKKEMENYIHHAAINRVFGTAIGNFNDFDDVPAIVAEAAHIQNGGAGAWAHLDIEKKQKKISRAKKRLNNEVVTAMTDAELNAIDVNQEIIGWFQAIAARLQ